MEIYKEHVNIPENCDVFPEPIFRIRTEELSQDKLENFVKIHDAIDRK